MQDQYTAIQIARFWAKVDISDACWLWIGNMTSNGYGKWRPSGRAPGIQALAHRVSWEIHYGRIPEGMCICHHCDVRQCIRPDHLFLGTIADNNADMRRKGRNISGARHPFRTRPDLVRRGTLVPGVKLTEDDVRAIRHLYASGGMSLPAIARQFGVCASSIGNITRGKTWAHLV